MKIFNNNLKKIFGSRFFKRLYEIKSQFTFSERIILYILSIVFVLSGLVLIGKLNDKFMVNVPASGGYLKEGIVGNPRFINPVLAVSDVDHDLSELVYSGLMKISGNNDLTPDLAESYEISSDGLEYTFTLKDNIYFHDGHKVTTDDVEFTINKILDPSIKSPKRPAFYDVNVVKINDKKIKFVLKKAYSPFLQNLTVGILPKHLWGNLTSEEFPLSQYNVEAIGSGPYLINKMETLKKNMLLIPTYYELIPFSAYSLNKPFIDKLIVNFYKDEKSLIDAYNNKEIESIGSISPAKMSQINLMQNSKINSFPLPRTFVIFFNQNQSEALSDKEVRKALNVAVDREKIISLVLNGYGKALSGPIPADLINESQENIFNPDLASSILLKDGWVKSTSTGILEKKISKSKTIQLEISISTLNNPDLSKTAELVKSDWEKIGVKVDIKQYDLGDLGQNVIRPRKFEALLYGIVVSRDMDFFAFWHSSQRNDPGLNISMYANSKVDKLLDDARKISDTEDRYNKYKLFEAEVKNDLPAIFLYSPEYIYITPGKVKNLSIEMVSLPFERFLNINNWYIETNNLWKVFLKK